jgi:hypothetical protein
MNSAIYRKVFRMIWIKFTPGCQSCILNDTLNKNSKQNQNMFSFHFLKQSLPGRCGLIGERFRIYCIINSLSLCCKNKKNHHHPNMLCLKVNYGLGFCLYIFI